MVVVVQKARKSTLQCPFRPSILVFMPPSKGKFLLLCFTPIIVPYFLTYYVYISAIASTHPWLVQRAQLDKAESQLLEKRALEQELQQRVYQLGQKRQEALHEIQSLRQEQLQQALLNLERRIKSEFQSKQAAEIVQFQRECQAMLLSRDVEEEEEPPTKRIKTNNNMEEDNDTVMETEEGQIQETIASSSNVETSTDNVATAQEEPETSQEAKKPSQAKRKQLEVCPIVIVVMVLYTSWNDTAQ